mmetsp:Transcript_34028/g.85439  ORF Transcript_34028/g.85439 Transcript_34028/m.85439 type:complete len:93 (-) Transcript_34028:1432-1710(-)
MCSSEVELEAGLDHQHQVVAEEHEANLHDLVVHLVHRASDDQHLLDLEEVHPEEVEDQAVEDGENVVTWVVWGEVVLHEWDLCSRGQWPTAE